MASVGAEQWSSRFAFIMAAVGSSVGLGNLWRFSAELGTNGGAAFLVIYLVCIILVGIPVLMSEFMIGRAGQAASAVGSQADIAVRSGVSRSWSAGAWFGMVSSFLIVSFYCVVAAWVLNYLVKFLGNSFSGLPAGDIAAKFPSMVGNPVSVLPYFLIFAGLTTWLVARGVNKGIETSARLLMPLFFILLAGLALYSIFSGMESGGTGQALGFMFAPDFSRITPEVMISALGQACFSIGIGNAIMITYGSYLPGNVDIPRAAVGISLIDTLVAVTAGLAIFPIVFSNELDFRAGAGIFFQTLPIALAEHAYIGAAFFFLAFFAAITSSVSLLEPTTAYVSEKFGIGKAEAAALTGIAITALGFGSLYSQDFFKFIDQGLVAPILAPMSALLVVLFTGWRLSKTIIKEQFSSGSENLGNVLMVFVRYIAPIFVAVILVMSVWDRYFT
ncbi:MAG: sodium-dependent transporter [Hyphomonadaceae bacterium]|nr:sodium-dependent transporter [Hyphomonadaceae bacterium]